MNPAHAPSEGLARFRDFLKDTTGERLFHWPIHHPSRRTDFCACDRGFVAAGERSVKSVFIHQFMDLDTFDLSRARKCCQVYPQRDGRLIPVCMHNCLKRNGL